MPQPTTPPLRPLARWLAKHPRAAHPPQPKAAEADCSASLPAGCPPAESIEGKPRQVDESPPGGEAAAGEEPAAQGAQTFNRGEEDAGGMAEEGRTCMDSAFDLMPVMPDVAGEEVSDGDPLGKHQAFVCALGCVFVFLVFLVRAISGNPGYLRDPEKFTRVISGLSREIISSKHCPKLAQSNSCSGYLRAISRNSPGLSDSPNKNYEIFEREIIF